MSSTRDAARWLEDSVGVGGVFTKEQLRAAFPGVTQIDRRVRDLRERGWVIDTRRQDPTLGQTEMRLVVIGGLDRPDAAVSPKDRRAALIAWAYSCCLCGAQGSTTYPDARHVRVQLHVREVPHQPSMLVPVCLRCSPTLTEFKELPSAPEGMVRAAADLSDVEWREAALARIAHRLDRAGQ